MFVENCDNTQDITFKKNNVHLNSASLHPFMSPAGCGVQGGWTDDMSVTMSRCTALVTTLSLQFAPLV